MNCDELEGEIKYLKKLNFPCVWFTIRDLYYY